jgi:hypothetical protein
MPPNVGEVRNALFAENPAVLSCWVPVLSMASIGGEND